MSDLEKKKGFPSSEEGGFLPAEIVKGVIGAIIGAAPGFLLWMFVAKTGYIACAASALLAVGSIGGCFLATSKKGLVTPTAMIIICAVVAIVSIYYAEKIVWCEDLLERFKDDLGKSRRRMYVIGSAADISQEDADKMVETSFKERYGYSRATFSNVFYHFGNTLKALDMKGKYIKHTLACYGAAALGAGGFFAKLTGK